MNQTQVTKNPTTEPFATEPFAAEVFNLATGEKKVFVGLTPEQAVTAAYHQSRGHYNTWDYDEVPLCRGRFSVAAGNWTALLK